jgi:hypothetical protein
MFSSWAGGLAVRVVFLAGATAVILGGAWLISTNLAPANKGLAQDEPSPEPATAAPIEPSTPLPGSKNSEVPLPGQPIPEAKPSKVVDVDLGSLSPELLKELQAVIKPISLVEAIAIAENLANGKAVKTDTQGEGLATQYNIDVLRKDGSMARVSLNATGNILERPKPSTPQPSPSQPGTKKGPPPKTPKQAPAVPGEPAPQLLPQPAELRP